MYYSTYSVLYRLVGRLGFRSKGKCSYRLQQLVPVIRVRAIRMHRISLHMHTAGCMHSIGRLYVQFKCIYCSAVNADLSQRIINCCHLWVGQSGVSFCIFCNACKQQLGIAGVAGKHGVSVRMENSTQSIRFCCCLLEHCKSAPPQIIATANYRKSLHNIAKNTTNQRKTGIRSQKYIFHETCSVLFSVLAGGKTYAVCSIFRPYAHAMFACNAGNARLQLAGIAENAKTGTNLGRTPDYRNQEAGNK